ncbi:NACHT domain-containing protein [Saccharopolyspora sp. NFXS83]|uniref:NACHT domain-containing protein n=1 Tax=Saccharopolyspora sp. NFXS83 TaxID=2993560 RepID=UPI00224AA6F4|nr:NACHT domain-containing protein [Saccharopolyspora sp. NFXS83]MCX2732387.1 NACHT domain-containing protein [Saccharopolyspora sp. NFXS83]
MTENETHNFNEYSGYGAETVVQANVLHGDVVFLPRSAALLSASDEQVSWARQLAQEVQALSAQEVKQRGISGSDALAVRWSIASDDLVDHWENVHGSAAGTWSLPLAGHFTAVRQTYQAIHSKRLVILGQAGAGKTVLAHRLILDLLETTATSGPVPVLFSLSDWNPSTTPLQMWLADRLARDFPFLGVPGSYPRSNAANWLVDHGLILPVLDGFDEIPDKYHSDAIDEITGADCPLVLTSRKTEYARAVRAAKAVGRAAAIEIQDLDLAEARRYLVLGTNKSRAGAWGAVFDHLNESPDSPASRNLISALTAPLMVMLVRVIYGASPDRSPEELLDTRIFPTYKSLEDYLLGAYLSVSYGARRRTVSWRPKLSPGQAHDWLGYLANHLSRRDTHDLVWWRLSRSLHPYGRFFVTTASYGFAYAVAFCGMDWIHRQVVAGLVSGVVDELVGGRVSILAGGMIFGLTGGIAIGIVVESGFRFGRTGPEPERFRLTLRRKREESWLASSRLKKLLNSFAKGLAFGLMFGFSFVLAVSALNDASRLILGFAPDIGLAVGLAGGFGNLVISGFSDNHHSQAASPWGLLRIDRGVALLRVFVVSAFVGTFFAFRESILAAILLGILTGAATLALSAWGHWLLYVRFWLALTGRLPWRLKEFLEDAYDRGVLRQSGAVYQFRHAYIRDYLVRRHRS